MSAKETAPRTAAVEEGAAVEIATSRGSGLGLTATEAAPRTKSEVAGSVVVRGVMEAVTGEMVATKGVVATAAEEVTAMVASVEEVTEEVTEVVTDRGLVSAISAIRKATLHVSVPKPAMVTAGVVIGEMTGPQEAMLGD